MNQSFKTGFDRSLKIGKAILDFVVPRKCFSCDRSHQPFAMTNLCIFCWNQIFHPKRYIFSFYPDFQIHAAGKYENTLKRMVVLAKFKRNILSIDLLSEMLHQTWKEQNLSADFITSVPSFYRRSIRRGVDLPGMLATELSKRVNVPVRFDVVSKKKYVKRQNKKTKEERIKNMRNVFRANPAYKGKTVVVIDDIVTTGSTVLACYRAMRKRRIKNTIILTAAKT